MLPNSDFSETVIKNVFKYEIQCNFRDQYSIGFILKLSYQILLSW